MAMYKLRFYKKSGIDKGNLDHEEFFSTKEAAFAQYRKVFVYSDYALNPTIWEFTLDHEWKRICVYWVDNKEE